MNESITLISTPVVFLHGFSGDQDGLRRFAEIYAGDDAVLVNLPGFGGSEVPAIEVQRDFALYVEATWQAIRRQVPEGAIDLVGHSHGAMMAFAIACAHPDEINKIELVCPVAMPRLLPRVLAATLIGLARIGLATPLVRFIAWQPMVDLVTRYSLQRGWSPEVRDRIIATRRHESLYYSPVMFEVMQNAVYFMKNMKRVYCDVPAEICYMSDDNIAGRRDHEWYQEHCRSVVLYQTTGGHLCVMTEPDRIVRELTDWRKDLA
jgi:pimeloyl-ACP methyl ester carboxylesterase